MTLHQDHDNKRHSSRRCAAEEVLLITYDAFLVVFTLTMAINFTSKMSSFLYNHSALAKFKKI